MRYIDLIENKNIRIESISSDDIDQILSLTVNTFKNHGMSDADIISYTKSVTDWNLSKKITLNNKLAGFLLLSPRQIEDIVTSDFTVVTDLDKFKNKRGVQGIALVILPEYKNKGLLTYLRNVPKNLGFDYEFGEQLKTLNNLNVWLRFAELIAYDDEVWITGKLF